MSNRTDGAVGPEDEGNGDFVQQVRHQQVSARVPESVGRGVFSTGAIVLVGQNEFVVDFVLRMTRPHQLAARVVMPHAVMPQFIHALKDNLDKYSERFGKPAELPRAQPDQQPGIQEIYDDMKLPEKTLCGAYANGVMVGHSPSEFSFDFIASFFPQSLVSCRVFLSAPQIPRLLESLDRTYDNFRQRVEQQRRGPDASDAGNLTVDEEPDGTGDRTDDPVA